MISHLKQYLSTGLLTLLAVLTGYAGSVRADIIVWQDTGSALGLSYPDSWAAVHNQQPHDVLTLAAPDPEGAAGCTARTTPDKRFSIYPLRYAAHNARAALNKDFWEHYFADNITYEILDISAGKSLGRGFAVRADATHYSFDQPGIQKQSITFASLYNGTVYSVSCAAPLDRFRSYVPLFMSIFKSVSFEKELHELPSGDYRPFLMDAKTWVRNGPDADRKPDTSIKKYW